MKESILSTIVLIGAVQGLVMSGLLLSMRANKLPARSLAWLLILISVASLYIWSWSVDSWQRSTVYAIITQCFPVIVIMPVGPLIWLYVRSVLDPGLKMDKNERRHFLPVVIDLVAPIVNLVYLGFLLTNTGKGYLPFLNRFVDDYNVYSDLPRWLSVTWYSWKSLQYLKNNLANPAIEQQADHIRWLRQFLYVFIFFLGIWLCQLVPYLIPRYTDWVIYTFGWYPVYVPLSLLIYVLGTKGYLQVKQLRVVQKKENASLYRGEQVAETIAALKNTMELDKLFLDPGLNLTILSAHTGLPQKQISAVLNQHINASFNEYVNKYRVQEVIARLSDPDNSKLTLAGLGYECGFNSQPTFQRAFKTVTGKTPSQYQASIIVSRTEV